MNATIIVGMRIATTNGLKGKVYAVKGDRIFIETRDGILCISADMITTGDGLVMHVDPDRPDAYKTGIIGSIVGAAVARGEEVAIVIGSRRRMIRGRS